MGLRLISLRPVASYLCYVGDLAIIVSHDVYIRIYVCFVSEILIMLSNIVLEQCLGSKIIASSKY